jgi:hypothetical protein
LSHAIEERFCLHKLSSIFDQHARIVSSPVVNPTACPSESKVMLPSSATSKLNGRIGKPIPPAVVGPRFLFRSSPLRYRLAELSEAIARVKAS